MILHRGDIVLVFYPFASAVGGNRRPALVVQSDFYNQRIRNSIVAQITTNLRRADDPSHLFLEAATPAGQESGLLHDSVVSCINLATLTEDRIDRVIGRLPDVVMRKIDACPRAALGL